MKQMRNIGHSISANPSGRKWFIPYNRIYNRITTTTTITIAITVISATTIPTAYRAFHASSSNRALGARCKLNTYPRTIHITATLGRTVKLDAKRENCRIRNIRKLNT